MISMNTLLSLAVASGVVSAQAPYTSLGCFNDVNLSPALRTNEARGFPSLDGTASARTDSINKCYQVAFQLGHTVFGIQNGACFSMADVVPGGDYARYGTASSCPADGRGGTLVNHVYQITGAANYVPDYNSLPYTSLGCWKDISGNRALRALEGDSFLDGAYFPRLNAINKCYQVASFRGLTVFGISDGGQCWGALDNVPGGDYARYGNSSSYCPRDGKGGTWVNLINHVYQIKTAPQALSVLNFTALPYNSLGCWNDQNFNGSTSNRALLVNEGFFPSLLDGTPKTRVDAVNKCYQAAQSQGHNVFSIQDGGACYSALDVVPGGFYTRYGNNSFCPLDGKGFFNINNVYQIKNAPGPSFDFNSLPYTSLGCWFDQNFMNNIWNRALHWNEHAPYTSILVGTPRIRQDAINLCYQVAVLRGHNVFGIQDGTCHSSLDVVPGGTYARYGNTSFCRPDGRGAVSINHVYQIKNMPGVSFDFNSLPFTSLGCWFDQNFMNTGWNRALHLSEFAPFTSILDGVGVNRTNAINKCSQVATLRGHNIFGLQDGTCYTALDIVPGGYYTRYGSSSFCRADGLGAVNINHVYQMKGVPGPSFDFDSLPYTSLGCWHDQNFMNNGWNRALRLNEGRGFATLDGNPRTRSDAISKCYQVALAQGHNVFGVQWGSCYSQVDLVPGGSYATYGNSSFCRPDGIGAQNINHVYHIKNAVGATTDYSSLPYTSLGCWLDASFLNGHNRALRSNEPPFDGTGILDGDPYSRVDTVNKCYQVASRLGHNVFAIQWGACYSQLDIVPGGSYSQAGPSSYCPVDGRGGPSVNHVYQIKNTSSIYFDWTNLPYSSMGCYADSTPRALRTNERLFATLDGNPANRTNVIHKCYQVALSQGHNVFALQNNGQCHSAFDLYPGGDYSRYGVVSYCPTDGKGAVLVNHVYRINSLPSRVLTFSDLPYLSAMPYSSLGCWADSSIGSFQALRNQEGSDSLLDGSSALRSDSINKCYQVALKRSHNVFALQAGACFSGMDSVPGGDYSKYGRSNLCSIEGRGASHVNSVYRINAAPNLVIDYSLTPYTSLGCFQDSTNANRRMLRAQEGTDARLDGTVTTRLQAIVKCHSVAVTRGHNVFALQSNGHCFSGLDYISGGNYSSLGTATFCPLDGRGGVNINHVYQVKNASLTPEPFTRSSNWTSLGCWNETAPRILVSNEGNALLDGSSTIRVDAIRKCYQVTKNRGHAIFALTNGGECLSSANATAHTQYGANSFCLNDGRGASGVMHAYQVLA